MVTEIVFIGRDNAIDLQLQDDSQTPGTLNNTDLSAATKVEVVINDGNSYDSTANPTVVMFNPVTGVVTLKLGTMFTAENVYDAQIVVYDAVNTNGVLWNPKFSLDVKADSF